MKGVYVTAGGNLWIQAAQIIKGATGARVIDFCLLRVLSKEHS